jgi:hypothetical protein
MRTRQDNHLNYHQTIPRANGKRSEPKEELTEEKQERAREGTKAKEVEDTTLGW